MFRIDLMKDAKKNLESIKSKLSKTLVIHYSCESFLNIKDGKTPRITSIAIQNFETSQTESFSIHKVAEAKKYEFNTITDRYDELEKEMLDEYFVYIQSKNDHYFIHWNMRDINYGFSAIEHRYIVLGGNPYKISDSNKIDLSILLTILYGDKYISHGEFGKLISLIKKNNITDRSLLNGKEEAEAFENGEYVKLHQSTLRKVNCISDILYKLLDNSLQTESTFMSRYGLHPKMLVFYLKDHWIMALITIVSILLGFGQRLLEVFR